MPQLDMFRTDAFGTLEMVAAINKLPDTPGRVGRLKAFTGKPLTNQYAAIEERDNKLSLVPTAARGTMPNVGSGPVRKTRVFETFYIPQNRTVMASELSGVRAFGSDTEQDTVANVVTEKLAAIKTDIDATIEWHRVGAIQGLLRDVSAGTPDLLNLFTVFDLTRTEVNFDFADDTDDIKGKCKAVKRAITSALGQQTFTKIYCICGNTFFDALIAHPAVTNPFTVEGNGDFFRQLQGAIGGSDDAVFEWGGITFISYDASIGAEPFVAADEANFFPVGVPDLFLEFYSPPEWMETVNTLGKPYYAKQEVMKWDAGVELHGNTSILPICSRPQCLILGTMGADA